MTLSGMEKRIADIENKKSNNYRIKSNGQNNHSTGCYVKLKIEATLGNLTYGVSL